MKHTDVVSFSFLLLPFQHSLGLKHEIDLEYDYNILDPHHADGSPFGGFSRAARQRLSNLPLIFAIPDTDQFLVWMMEAYKDLVTEQPAHTT